MDFNFVFIILLGMIPLLFFLQQRTVNCPDCGKRLPAVGPPWRKTRRQWVNGGFVCDACHIEVDIKGKAVPNDAAPISGIAVIRAVVPLVLVPVLVIVASYFVLFWAMDMIKSKAMAAEVEPTAAATILRHKAPQACYFDQARDNEVAARIVLHEHGLIHGGDLYSFGVELENLSLGVEVWVEFDAQDVKLKVNDEHGHAVPLSSVQRSGPTLPVYTALIPPSGYTVFSTHDQGMGIVPGQKRFNTGYEAWHLKPGTYQVSGIVLVRIAFPQKDKSDDDRFTKDQPKLKLTIPTVKLIVDA